MRRTAAIPSVLALLAACSAPVVDPPAPLDSDWARRGLAAGPIPEGLPTEIRAPGGSPAAGGEVQQGDRLLFALELDEGQTRERWLVAIDVTEAVWYETDSRGRRFAPTYRGNMTSDERRIEITSKLFAGSLRLFDGEGEVLGATTIQVPRMIARGMVETCELFDELSPLEQIGEKRTLSDEEHQTITRSMLACMSAFSIIQADPLLNPILKRLVRPPSWISLVRNLGLEISLSPDFDGHEPVPREEVGCAGHALGERPFYAIPATIAANGEPALLLELLVTTPEPPLAACGGLLGIEARHPTREDLRFSMVLVGAEVGE